MMKKQGHLLYGFYIAICICILSCELGGPDHSIPRESVKPVHFKTTAAFQIGPKGIFIDTYWGKDKTKQSLLFDTHAPTSAAPIILNSNPSVHPVENLFYRTTTPDSKSLNGRVYMCDSISFGAVTFDNVVVYDIDLNHIQSSDAASNGMFGDNLISTGIWKIDFENKQVTFTSNIDSLGKLENVNKIPAELKDNILYINAGLQNSTTVRLGVDFGYTGEVIIRKQIFKTIDTLKNSIITKALFTSAAGAELTTKYILYNETLQLGGASFSSAICTNDLISADLVGLAFFSRFKFVILDYLNKAIYFSVLKQPL